MPVVQAKCTSCGANLQVDSSSDTAICPYCKSAYIVEKAINNYNTSVKIDNLSADVVNIQSENNIENQIKAAETFIQLRKYNKAIELLEPLTEKYPFDYRTWWGLVEAETQMFERINAVAYKSAIKYYEAASQIATGSDKENIDRIFSEYTEKVKAYCNETANKVAKLNESINNKYFSQITNLKEDKEYYEKKHSNSKVILLFISCISICVFFLGIFILSKSKSFESSPLGIICLFAPIIGIIIDYLIDVRCSKNYEITSENYDNLVNAYNEECADIEKQYPQQLYIL